MMEEYRSGDIEDCVIVFDRNPTNEWLLKVKIIMLAGRPFVGMPLVLDDIARPQDLSRAARTTMGNGVR